MNLNFIPYKLKADISDFKGSMEYISSDNGVDLYRVDKGHIEPLLGFKVAQVNLYFLEGSLITIYVRLSEKAASLGKVKEVLDKAILQTGNIMEADSGLLYYWQDNSQFLGLLIKEEGKFLLLYNSLNEFNIFNP